MADVALWLGPYMSISGKTSICTICTRTKSVWKGKSQSNKQNTNQPDDPQIPQPDLRFVKRNNKPDKEKKGPEPNKNTHQKDLPTDAVV